MVLTKNISENFKHGNNFLRHNQLILSSRIETVKIASDKSHHVVKPEPNVMSSLSSLIILSNISPSSPRKAFA
jgi:hypothetical protein